MRILQTIIAMILTLAILPSNLIAVPVEWYDGNYEIRNDNEWYHIIELHTYNFVTVKMFEATSVNSFSMYGNSEFTRYDGSVAFLYLYDNTAASFLGGSDPMELYIDPASTAVVKLYADFDKFEQWSPYGEGYLYGNWLSNGDPFSIKLVGNGAYSHIQFIPEPATLVLIGLGGLAAFRRRLR